MDMETWFAPAIEMGRLVRQYRIAQEDEKEELERRIQNSAYISRLNTMQSFNSVDFLRGIVEEDAGGGKAEGEGERKLRQPGQQPFRLQAGPVYTGRIFPERREMQTHRPEPPSVMALCGYAMPERIQRRDAQLLRRELGCNVVRTSHYPQSRHFLDACDELGLLVMEEIPGWRRVTTGKYRGLSAW